MAIKFIDEQKHILRFIQYAAYATLYQAVQADIKAYLPLGDHPRPSLVSAFYTANAIDTASKAKRLVMGAIGEGSSGIIVYQFDEKTLSLTRFWSPPGSPPHPVIDHPHNCWEG